MPPGYMAYNVMHIDTHSWFFMCGGPKSTGRFLRFSLLFFFQGPRRNGALKNQEPGVKGVRNRARLGLVAVASLNLTHVPHKLCLPPHTYTHTHRLAEVHLNIFLI